MMWRSSDAMHSGEDLDIMSRWSSDEDQFLETLDVMIRTGVC